MGSKPQLSLIVATVGRTEPLRHLLASLEAQTRSDFEVLVVDQNDDDRVRKIICLEYGRRLVLQYLRSSKGLSIARNCGLKHVTGEFVGFPDDDCWYDPATVEDCLGVFAVNPNLDGFTGVARDAEGRLSAARWDSGSGQINRCNVMRRGISFTLFCRTSVARQVAGFDESLGVGAKSPWGSGEETDFIIRCLDTGARFEFMPSFAVRHPQVSITNAKQAKSRALPYGRGYQRVLIKHQFRMAHRCRALARPLLGCCLFLLTGRFTKGLTSWWTFVGRASEEIRHPAK